MTDEKQEIRKKYPNEGKPGNVTVPKRQYNDAVAKGNALSRAAGIDVPADTINVLRDERVVVRFIRRQTDFIKDPQHVMYGGMHEKGKRRFVLPMYTSGSYVNVLTDAERRFLEHFMGLEEDALSIYKKENNFWANRHVLLGKEDTLLDLSTPDGYIDYKILLANKEFIAPSREVYDKTPKASYQYVIIQAKDKNKVDLSRFTATAKAFKLLSSIEDDVKKLAGVVFLSTGRFVSPAATRDDVLLLVKELMENDPSLFVSVLEDPYFETKTLINRCVTLGLIRNVQRLFFLSGTNQPLCEDGQDPTLEVACVFLNSPRNQEILFKLQGKLAQKED